MVTPFCPKVSGETGIAPSAFREHLQTFERCDLGELDMQELVTELDIKQDVDTSVSSQLSIDLLGRCGLTR